MLLLGLSYKLKQTYSLTAAEMLRSSSRSSWMVLEACPLRVSRSSEMRSRRLLTVLRNSADCASSASATICRGTHLFCCQVCKKLCVAAQYLGIGGCPLLLLLLGLPP